jgi:putative Mg2+ transporter-C (MgtC) family protein
MNEHYTEIAVRLLIALAVGGIIGLERSYHGRPAGFRTHTLVCVASSLLMLVTVYESLWFVPNNATRVVVDPTRMAQGIMTGIGFLGAGVIMKDGLSVRGLTTAASIWITAAIGILAGIGFYFPAAVATALTLGTLSLFRWLEARMHSRYYAHHTVRFASDAPMPEPQYRQLLKDQGFSIANLSYRLHRDNGYFEYQMVIWTHNQSDTQRLTEALSKLDVVREFRISPTGD